MPERFPGASRPEGVHEVQPVADPGRDPLVTADPDRPVPIHIPPRGVLGDICKPHQPAVRMLQRVQTKVAKLILRRQDRDFDIAVFSGPGGGPEIVFGKEGHMKAQIGEVEFYEQFAQAVVR